MIKTLILVITLSVFPSTLFAAGTGVVTVDDGANSGLRVITMVMTADASDGSYPATSTDAAIDGYLCRVIVDPDGTAVPTDNYDATLTDSYGIDVMEGTLANLDTTATVAVDFVPTVNAGASTGCVVVRGPLTLTLTGNSVNSAKTTVSLFVVR